MKIVAKIVARLGSVFVGWVRRLKACASARPRCQVPVGFTPDVSSEAYEAAVKEIQESGGLRLRLDHSSQDGHFRV